MTDDTCGAETGNGGECQNPATEGDSCWIDSHGGDCSVGRPSLLEQNPSITDLVAGELQSGATVPEACAEARISTSAYHEWRRRGRQDEAKDVFVEFLEQTGRARKVDSHEKRRQLWEKAMETGDIRTAYKLYHDQHGDTFDEEGGDGDAADGIPLVVPDSARPDV